MVEKGQLSEMRAERRGKKDWRWTEKYLHKNKLIVLYIIVLLCLLFQGLFHGVVLSHRSLIIILFTSESVQTHPTNVL